MTTLQTILAAVNWNVRVNENFEAVSPAALFARRASTSTGLTLGYYGGVLDGVSYADGTHALTASTTRYVVVARATGVVSSATSTTNWNDSTNYLRMGIAVVGASTFSWTDWRQSYGGASGGGGGFTNPMTTTGDIIYASSGSTPARLGVGSTGDVLTVVAGVPAWAAASSGGSGLSWNAQTASYTLALGDANNGVEMLVASANNLTVPLNATVAFPVGTSILIYQAGAGLTTVVATGGVTIVKRGTSLAMGGQYALATLVKRATDTWILSGDIAP